MVGMLEGNLEVEKGGMVGGKLNRKRFVPIATLRIWEKLYQLASWSPLLPALCRRWRGHRRSRSRNFDSMTSFVLVTRLAKRAGLKNGTVQVRFAHRWEFEVVDFFHTV